MVSQKVVQLCQSGVSVSSELAKNPTSSAGEVAKKLFGHDLGGHAEHTGWNEPNASPEDLQLAFQCGKWGPTRPSELFIKIYHDVLTTLEHDPLNGMVSPSLMGSCGVVPLTIISPLPDIVRHMSNCIARAEKEVFLATNYWKASEATLLITNALKELSRRAGERGQKVIVKVMYDRGNPKQVINNHQTVSVDEYTGKNVKMPHPDEVPNLDMQVVNYHRPVFGTFHCKYMVVDRKIAILSSNNLQDNDNVEMMTHLEGPIVDSFYDVCLTSWHNKLEPSLPCLNSPAANGGLPAFEHESHTGMFDENGVLKDLTGSNSSALGAGSGSNPSQVAPQDPHFKSQQAPGDSTGDTAGTIVQNQPPQGSAHDNFKADNLASITQAGNKITLPEHTGSDPHYDVDIAAEVLRAQSVLSPRNGESRMHAVTRHMNTTIQPDTTGDAPECAVGDEMTTYIPLPAHELVPMAMVCRKPWGAPNHSCVHTPQNAAFISAVRNAQRDIFIQTPNLNAEPLLPELIAAAKRKVHVVYYVCLGYNDSGELLPFQGGTNEMVANKLYKELTTEEKQYLDIYNYVAKDQTKPIHNKFKKRSCHVKLLIVDGHIGIQGNGNQDTQTWFHSQEINFMIDSSAICAAWAEGIRRNQNTHLYGAVSKDDGCWHDREGNQADGAIGVDPGHFSWAKGIVGAVQRVRGAGGF